jgi:hypothetical protein
LAIKYGLRHIKPNNEEVQDYLNKITPGSKNLNEFIMEDYSDIISETIPKKSKKTEFQVTNESKRISKNSHSYPRNSEKNKNDTQSFSDVSSEFLYSSIKNESNQTALIHIPKIEEPKQVASIISSIKKENKIEIRKELSNALENITNPNCLTRFLQLNGTTHLGYWIDDYREEIETKNNIDGRVFEILENILNFCDKLPISVHDLKISKIGKKINKLGKCLENEKIIKSKCEDLVHRWKKMIEDMKDKKKSNYESKKRERESRYLNTNDSSDEKTTPDIILSPTKHNSNQSHFTENFSMRKTQRTEIESADKNYKKYISITILYFITICLFLFKTLHINSLNILFVLLIKE